MLFNGKMFKKNTEKDIQNKINRLKELFYAEDGTDETDLECFNLAKEILQNNPDCDEDIYILGLCYFQGAGTNRDYEKAKDIFLKLADKGYEGSYRLLGDIAWNSKNENDREHNMCFTYYSRYLDSYPDCDEVKVFLAECYAQGVGVKKDIDKAFDIFRELTSSDIALTADFQYRYAVFLDDPMNSEESLIWYKRAYEQGDAFSAYMIATILMEKNYFNAIEVDRSEKLKLVEFYLREAMRLGEGTEVALIAKNKFNIYIAKLETGQL